MSSDKPTQLPEWLRWGENWPLPAREPQPPVFITPAPAPTIDARTPAARGIAVVTPLKPILIDDKDA
jgi:hypothetical protein